MSSAKKDAKWYVVLFQRITLIGTILVVIGWGVVRGLNLFPGFTLTAAGQLTPESLKYLEGLLYLVVGMVTALAIYEVLRSFEKSVAETNEAETREAVQRIEKALQDEARERKVSVVKSPSATPEYIELWSGFTGYYYAYNACYQVEQRPGIDSNEIIKKVFVARYADPKFTKACYLFLTKDDAGKGDLEKFRAFMKRVKALCPDVVDKVEVKELQDKAAREDSEVYRGDKNGLLTSVVEPSEQALTGGRGNPFYYLVITDREMNSRLKEQFDALWHKGATVDIFKEPSTTPTTAGS
jgi:hypothetical protein